MFNCSSANDQYCKEREGYRVLNFNLHAIVFLLIDDVVHAKMVKCLKEKANVAPSFSGAVEKREMNVNTKYEG